eukprot:1159968-Pelagomonas_calceolata.AAC.17
MVDFSISSAATATAKGAPTAAVPAGVICVRVDGIQGVHALMLLSWVVECMHMCSSMQLYTCALKGHGWDGCQVLGAGSKA